jgi:CHAT domain-containing protein
MAALAQAERLAGRPDAARASVEGALARAEAKGEIGSSVRAHLERARQRREADPKGAAADSRIALELARKNGLFPAVPAALVELAQLASAAGDLDAAVRLFGESAAAIERIRGRILSPELRAAFGDAAHATYAGLVAARLRLHDREPQAGHGRLALLALERERSQKLQSSLQGAAVGRGGEGRRRDLERRIAEVQVQLFSAAAQQAHRPRLIAELEDLERDLALHVGEAETAGTGAPERLEPLQATLAPEEAALVYSIDASRPVVFVVTRDALRVVSLPAAPSAAEQVDAFTTLLSGEGAREAVPVGRSIAAALLQPAIAGLPEGVRRLVIVASGALAGLPFAALPDPAVAGAPRPLLARFELASAPSLALLAQLRGLRTQPPPRDLVALANPARGRGAPAVVAAAFRGDALGPLPHSEREARSAVRRASAGSELLVDRGASESSLKALPLREYKVLHFATHALLDPRVPARSAILLAQPDPAGEDGLLQAREVYGLDLDARLVVLSACRTAAGRRSNAESLQSLARSFLFAGAHSVAGTLWDVADAATAELVDRFYAGLARGLPVAAALREAQLAQSSDPYANARNWAGFVVAGDPLARVQFTPATAVSAGRLAAATVGLLGLAVLVLWRARRNPSERRAPV